MLKVGIVAEFNPFHEGHKYLIDRVREHLSPCTIIAAMSGNFVQRGELAFYDKWTRTKMAMDGGVDLVIELPVVFSTSGSRHFAQGAVKILESMNIDYLAFGSEEGNLDSLISVVDFIKKNKSAVEDGIFTYLKEGFSYPKAREKVLSGHFDNEIVDLISQPNNILALEYLLALKNAKPLTVKRFGESHHESGSSIRKKFWNENPQMSKTIESGYFKLLCGKIATLSEGHLNEISGGESGLGSKVKNSFREAENLETLIDLLKSKAFTRTRISRYLTQIVLDIPHGLANDDPEYIRVLGANENGRFIIKNLKKTEECNFPIITNINKDVYGKKLRYLQLEKDILASDIFNIINNKDLYGNSDYVMKPIIE